MDCLFLRADSRGSDLGALLVEAVVAEARDLGLYELHAKEKLRYG
ncbi:hypothetical protein [Streptomyces capitiformicae]|nr:hypothetical protein [Streptomyces capitiformicae]